MPLTYVELHQQLQDEGYFERISLNPLAQFGSEQQPLLGARYLPEILVAQNSYEETQIRYRTKPALDGTRYSPAQMQRGGHLIGSFKVDLGHTDTADEMTGQDHDGLVQLLMQDRDQMGIAQVIRWADNCLVRPHVIKNELQRWQAIVLGQVTRQGSNGHNELVEYYKPTGHRPEIPGGTTAAKQGWHLGTYDPYDDIFAGKEKLAQLGYEVTDMLCTAGLMKVLRNNAKIATRTSQVAVNASGQIQGTTGYVSDATLNQVNSDNGLPPFTVYNGGYETATGFKRYLDLAAGADYLVMMGRTMRQWDMVTDFAARVADSVQNDVYNGQSLVLDSTLGYYGVGRNVGASGSGRTIHTEVQEKKPKGYYGEAYQTGLPVITEPEALYIIKVNRPTAA